MDEFNEGLQKLGKTLIPETELATPNGARFDPSEIRTRRTPLDKINDPIEARANENLSGVKKAVNLPSWDKLTVDMEHITSGHKVGGSRLNTSNKMGGAKDVFPEWMTDKQILSAIKEAYKNAKKIKTQVDGNGDTIIKLLGQTKELNIEIYVNTSKNIINTQ